MVTHVKKTGTDWKRATEVLKATSESLQMLSRQRAALTEACTLLSQHGGTVLVSGVGKSAHIGHKIAATLTSLGKRALFLDPLHALHGDSGFVSMGDVVIVISYSGASKEVVKLASHLKKEFGVRIIAITGKKHSALAKIANVTILTLITQEGSPLNLAPMASTTAALVVGDMLAAALTDPEVFKKKHFAKFHPSGHLGLETKKVGDVTFGALPLVEMKNSLQQALVVMTKFEKGIVGVRDERGVLKGVITDGDLRRFLMKKTDVSKAIAKDCMSRRPKCIAVESTLADALQMMENHKITSLFVEEGNAPIGIIHMHDIVERI